MRTRACTHKFSIIGRRPTERLSRERRGRGVRFMITIPVTDDALDAWVDDCELSLEESHDRKRVTEFVEDLVNSPGRGDR